MQNHACFSKMNIKQFLSFYLETFGEIVTFPANRDAVLLLKNLTLWNFAAHFGLWYFLFVEYRKFHLEKQKYIVDIFHA